ncbi:hypothetical protein FOA43_002185 [Brettanomyces nanus]|uniref:Uncharacterized protein n=1 Tax=Eeniella nana TaxID=13502 RepID=A0A875S506_EENNA|nr:uncharacterized protein FOA43_002185 [Brettanomyces nanus]QPG74849.1 hypothetical protein FOA43_002185 [Brettanomyces nanus]
MLRFAIQKVCIARGPKIWRIESVRYNSSGEKPAEESVHKPAEESIEKPAEESIEKPAEESIHKPVEFSTEFPTADMFKDIPTESPIADMLRDIPTESASNILLPWEENTEGNDEDNAQNSSTDHLILAPFRRKYSPLEKFHIGRTQEKNKSNRLNENYFNVVDFERDVKSLMVFKQDISSTQLYNKIDEFKPKEAVISAKRYNQLVGDLKSAFKLSQLRHYAEEKEIVGVTKSITKARLITKIIKDYWKVSLSDRVIDQSSLNTEAHIALQNRRELFLLLSHRGYITNSWSRLGAKLSLSPENDELIVSGSPNIVSFVQVSWNELLNNVQSITLKLKKLRNFYDTELHREMPIDALQELSNVYFDKISDNDQLYVLSSFTQANLSLAKSALLAATEYSGTATKELDKTTLTRTDLIYKEYNDPSLPWYAANGGPIYRLKVPKIRTGQSSSLSDVTKTSSLFEELKELKEAVDKSEERFEMNFIDVQKSGKTKEEPKETEDAERRIETTNTPAFDFDSLSKSLLQPVEKKSDWMPNIINATLGRVLFQGKSTSSNMFFHSNFPEVNRKLSQLSLLDKESHLFGSAGGIKNQFTHVLQIKLVPDGFKKFTNFKDLPNIEIWFDVHRNQVDLQSCNMFVNECECNYHIPLPQYGTDVKFQSSFNSMLINSEFDDNLIFNKKQKPLFKFLNRIPDDLLDLGEANSVSRLVNSIQNHTIAIKLDDRYRKDSAGNTKKINKNVPYLITSVSRKRSIELEFEGVPVIYEVVDDTNGERYEVSILSKVNETADDAARKTGLKKFSDKVFRFVEFLQN